jgi:hypothetical protein
MEAIGRIGRNTKRNDFPMFMPVVLFPYLA